MKLEEYIWLTSRRENGTYRLNMISNKDFRRLKKDKLYGRELKGLFMIYIMTSEVGWVGREQARPGKKAGKGTKMESAARAWHQDTKPWNREVP